MSKKTRNFGYKTSGRSSDSYMAPQNPYTGDGKTTRSIFDKVVNVFLKPNGKKAK